MLSRLNGYTIDHSGYFLIVISDTSTNRNEMITQILHHCWAHNYVNVHVLLANMDDFVVEVYTYFPYASTHCEEVVPELINRYVEKSFEHPVEFVDKFQNMHGCRLYVAPLELAPFVMYARYPNGSISVHGIEISVLEEISKRLNFTFKINIVPPQSTYVKWRNLAFEMVIL